MAVKLRLQRHGRGKRPFYHIVASDSRARRDGKYIERIGEYNPLTSPATISVDVEKAVEWLMKGAEPTDTVHAILKYKGAMYKKHLLRGVAKGALTQEAADKTFAEWIDAHQNSVLDHKKKVHLSKEDRLKKLMEEETKKTVKLSVRMLSRLQQLWKKLLPLKRLRLPKKHQQLKALRLLQQNNQNI
jgi:small subunit ribosomal protein S16